jgi:FdhD protein
VFGDLMADIDSIELPEATITQSQLYGIVNTIRLNDSVYKTAGSVHGCALFQGARMLRFVEDVGRHNALDAIAGWMAMQADECAAPGARTGMAAHDKVFYTTGRLTSEMIIKSAQMGVPVVISRSGITQMGHQVAQRLNLCAIGRATNKRFLCFSAPQRLLLETALAGVRLRVA